MTHDAWPVVVGFGSIGITVATVLVATYLVWRNWRHGR